MNKKIVLLAAIGLIYATSGLYAATLAERVAATKTKLAEAQAALNTKVDEQKTKLESVTALTAGLATALGELDAQIETLTTETGGKVDGLSASVEAMQKELGTPEAAAPTEGETGKAGPGTLRLQAAAGKALGKKDVARSKITDVARVVVKEGTGALETPVPETGGGETPATSETGGQ